MSRTSRSLTAALAALGLAAPAFASGDVLPTPRKAGEITYLSGGVGEREQKAIEREADDYDLQVTIDRPDGAYLAGSAVRIETPDGTDVLDTTAQGPMFLAQLPRGRYVLHASLDGYRSEKRVVDVSDLHPTRIVVTLAREGTEKTASAEPADTADAAQR
jgi:hypothetical protein